MKNLLTAITGILLFIVAAAAPPTGSQTFAGLQPQLALDNAGTVRLVFGRSDSIFCATSKDGRTFSEPQFVAAVPGMHLGNTRGPQVASSAHYSVITAIDKSGAIHFYRLNHATGAWQNGGLVNDKKGSAPEGLMGLAADAQDHFYAVWLDIRQNQHNNICFSTLDGAGSWSKNRLVYVSPDGHVCECCKPNIAVNAATVAIQFRNLCNGARDLYLLRSSNSGRTFAAAQKLGTGTWKLNACPMDGGGLAVAKNAAVHTVWQREGVVYYCEPGASEKSLAQGRSCSLAASADGNGTFVLLQQDGQVSVIDVATQQESTIGNGNFARAVVLRDGTLLCAWEEAKTVHLKQL